MKSRKNGIPMRMKIMILCMVLALSAVLLQTLLYSSTSSNLIYQQAKEENQRILGNMLIAVEAYADTIESKMLIIYIEGAFMLDLRQNVSLETLQKKWYRLAYEVGTNNFNTSDGVVAFYLYTDNHEIISTYRRATTPKHNYPVDIYDGTQETNSETVKEYIESDSAEMLVSSYYNIYRETDIVRFVVKFYQSGSISNMVGYAVCDVDSKVLRYLMNKYTDGYGSYVWLQPLGDRAITATGSLEAEEMQYCEEMSSQIAQKQIGEEKVLELDGKVFFRSSEGKHNIEAYALMMQSLLEKNQKVLVRNLMIISAVICIAAMIFSLLISRGLTKKLEGMTETVTRIKGGETRLRMKELGNDEIGELGSTINEMLDQIEGLIAKEYEAKLMINKAEYKALQAQINPHFLYNTLDTMSSIAEIQDCHEVSALSQSLSNIFHYCLDMKHPFSTVAKEIVHLKNYIYVMDVRMRGEIKYVFEIEDSVLQDTLPRLSIQPLVENAINHGLKNARGEKYVVIRAYEKQEDLRIEVEDNGIGIEQEKLQGLLTSPEEMNGKDSIGLWNIHLRMKMLYGESYGLELESEEGKGTRVYLKIPKKTMNEVELWKTNIKF